MLRGQRQHAQFLRRLPPLLCLYRNDHRSFAPRQASVAQEIQRENFSSQAGRGLAIPYSFPVAISRVNVAQLPPNGTEHNFSSYNICGHF
jgi:hypothetical protein